MQKPQLVHVDDALIAADKPADLLSVPGRGPQNADCLAARLQSVYADALIVHRLDMATSGLMMFFVEKPSFTIQMHPVHKTFGILMVAAAIAHLSLNFRGLLAHLKTRSVAVYGSVLAALLVAAYGVAIHKTVPPELAQQMDAAAAKAEAED